MTLALLLLFLLQTLATSLEQPFNVSTISNGVHVDRHFSLSTTAPVTAAIRRSKSLQARILPGFDLFDKLAAIVDERKSTNASDACNLGEVTWTRATRNQIRARQVGEISDQCNTVVVLNDPAVGDKVNQPNFGDKVKSIIIDVKDALFQAQRDIPDIPDPRDQSLNWTMGAIPLRDWDLRRSGQICTSDNLFAYRKNGVWYMRAGVTNKPVDAFVPDYQRQFVDEFIPRDWSDPLRMPQVKYGGGEIQNASTVLSRFGGIPGLASVSVMVFDENPALTEALRLHAIAVDQAEDAVTISNIAILALPMVMTLFPVAFLVDLNTCAMLYYIIFTDVFAALPFLIKGVELVDSATSERGEAVAYHIGNETLGQMEVWAAECRGEDNFRVLGIIFICVAIFAIVGGVLLEVVAAAIMQKRRADNKFNATGPFGKALFESTAFSALGSANEEEWETRLSADLEEGRWSYEDATYLDLPEGYGATGHEMSSVAEETGVAAPSRIWRWIAWENGREEEEDGTTRPAMFISSIGRGPSARSPRRTLTPARRGAHDPETVSLEYF